MPKTRKEPQQVRRSAHRKLHPRLFIVCEGKTEYLYFTALKTVVDWAVLKIVPTRGDRTGFKAIISAARTVRQKYRAPTFCVCDHDGRPDWPAACQQMRARGLTPILSVPCFEYWLLLHFTSTPKPFSDCKQAEGELKKRAPNYNKTNTQVIEPLASKFAIAAKNAASLYGSKDACAQTAGSSYTNLHELVEFLLDMKAEKEGEE